MNLIWTKDKCRDEALKYKNRKDFQNSSRPAYNSAWRNNWLDEICGHMVVRGNLVNRAIYSFEFSDNKVYIGLTYDLNKRKNEHLTNPKSPVFIHMSNSNLIPIFKQLSGYIPLEDSKKMEGLKIKEYKDNNWIILNRKIHGDVGSSLLKWSYDSCKEEAMKYSDRTSFMRNSSGAYKSATINGWLEDITKHMSVKMKKKYWTKDKCHIEALKYDTKNKFKINSCDAYTFAYRNGFLDEICSHMRKFHKGFRGYKKNESIMKNIKSYKLFIESLQDDFINSIKSLNEDDKKEATDFLSALSASKDKQEFMYRISDGEGLVDLIEEFVDKCNLSDSHQFQFRSYVMFKRLEDIKSKYDEGDRNAGTELVSIAAKDGVDKTMKYLEQQIEKRPDITPDRIIELIQTSIDWLQENEVLINWTYQRDQNANAKMIEAGKILIDRLKEFIGD